MIEGRLESRDGIDWYRIDGIHLMEPFLMNIVSSTDLWMFASSRGPLTAGRRNADHALLPYETDDRLHRAVEVTGPVTIVARTVDGRRQVWRPFGRAVTTVGTARSLAKSLLGDRLVMEETHHEWGLRFRATWAPAPSFGWVRTVELTDLTGGGSDLEVLDGLIDVMPSGVDAVTEQLTSNLVDAYKRSEIVTGTAALFTLESLITDRAEPAESLTANLWWSLPGPLTELHLDERVIGAMRHGDPSPSQPLLTGRRGAYLLRGPVRLDPSGTATWTMVGDAGLDHAALIDRLAGLGTPDVSTAVGADIDQGSTRLSELLESADGYQNTGDPIADAHHLSNVMFNSMRGGLLPHGHLVPIADFLGHLARWNADVHRRHGTAIEQLGDRLTVRDLREHALTTGDPDLIRLTLEYLPLAFSRRHGDPSRPWNRFSIHVRSDSGEEILGYEGNWRDIFQNWEALLMSHPAFLPHAVAKFVNGSTVDGHNPYRISHRGLDWEEPDPDDPWANIGYWGDHQIVYLHRLLTLWDRVDPDGLGPWLTRPVFAYADVPYVVADHDAMVANPRATITFDSDRAEAVAKRIELLGADGRLVVDDAGNVHRVTLLEKLIVPALAKLSAYVPGGGIWMNTQRPEWNDANNALAGYGLSMVTLYHLSAYLTWLAAQLEEVGSATVAMSPGVAEWLRLIAGILSETPAEAVTDDRLRRQAIDALATAGSEYRERAANPEAATVSVSAEAVGDLCRAALDHLSLSIAAAARPDGLYDAYNLLSFPTADRASVEGLPPMLEGQAAALVPGVLDPEQATEIVEALYASDLYRPDQHSFTLYPVRRLPGFLERNVVDTRDLTHEARAALVGSVLVEDGSGGVHFSAAMVNAEALEAALTLTEISPDDRRIVHELYERTFLHHGYTGRSGSMYGYEGIGSIYWHMVGKLLVALQETYQAARDQAKPDAVVDGLAGAYLRVRDGLGFSKDPASFGAVPTDCYSHTPAHSGAQQPGMTGQVKEQIITRFGELGLRLRQGSITLSPGLLPLDQIVANGEGRFTYCGTRFEIAAGAAPAHQVLRAGGWSDPVEGLQLDADTSRQILDRTGSVEAVRFTIEEKPHE